MLSRGLANNPAVLEAFIAINTGLDKSGLIPNLVDTDPFHGGGLALPVRRAARRDAGPPDSEMAGKPRPKSLWAAGGPSRRTEGRHPLPTGVAHGLLAVPAP